VKVIDTKRQSLWYVQLVNLFAKVGVDLEVADESAPS